MKFKRGSKVEVFSTKEVSSGSWYLGEIIRGNGHYYTVKYDHGIGVLGQEKLDRVPRKAIRPCPPVMKSMEDWAPGQIAEVFHCFSWKMATVLRILQRDRLLVRLSGSSHGIEVRKTDIRPRLCWQHDGWKVHDNCEEMPESIPSQSLKRKLKIIYSSDALPIQKIRVLGNHKQNQLISTRQVQLPEKVDAIASSRRMMVEKRMPSINNKLTGLSRSRAMRLDSRGEDSIESSVASCSISKNKMGTGSSEHNECSGDAESFFQRESENGNSLVPAGYNLIESVHRIELLAYHNIIEALYASGPLSWEKESLLTDLRDSLHITTDEHLMEVRHVLSSTSSPGS